MLKLEELIEFEHLELNAQVELFKKKLEDAGFKAVEIWSKRGRRTLYYADGNVVVALVIYKRRKTENEIIHPVLLPRFYFEKYLKSERRSLCMSIRNDNQMKVVVNGTGRKSMPALHQEVMKEMGVSFDNMVIDHKFGCVWINVEEALRGCTSLENRHNRRFHYDITKESLPEPIKELVRKGCPENEIYSAIVAYEKAVFGEYAYNPLQDYRETWFAYMLYRMHVLSSEDELREYQKSYILRNNERVARYYASILEE